uniref:CCHC-type domain-containing protein n=1 Tax=Mastacembelus armatus TaxID=205130 RepID=A0A7N8WTI0_9TELE
MKDPIGYWTGRRQCQVLLKPDKGSKDGMAHPPALFQMGADWGYIYYVGQPPFCRRCRGVWHTEAECGNNGCRICGQEGHNARDCTVPKACHGCGERGHLYRDCGKRARTFAEVVMERGEGTNGIVGIVSLGWRLEIFNEFLEGGGSTVEYGEVCGEILWEMER